MSVGDDVEMHTVTTPVIANIVDAEAATEAGVDTDVADEVVVLQAASVRREAAMEEPTSPIAEVRRKAVELTERGAYDEADALLTSAIGDVGSSMAASRRTEELEHEIAELRYGVERLRSRTFDELERKRMHYQSYRSLRSRARREWVDPDARDQWRS